MRWLWSLFKFAVEACFPMMNCRKCGARTGKVEDGLCPVCWWDDP